jgi:DNA-binding CsgD family transcriptional regulator/tetratricopeptide (TPR) repeat protein
VPPTTGSRIGEGTVALRRGDWEDARAAFSAALEAEPSGAAWEGLGWAAWWLSDEATTLRAREAAYRAHRAEGDDAAAGRVAAWLASDFREFRGEDAVARGWLVRAHRLLDPLPESADHGWLALNEGSFALNVELDPQAAARHARFAARLGRELGVADLEAVGLALDGIAEVIGGRVAEGMRLLDEASTIAAAEELRFPLSQGWALCYLIAACDGVGDFPRATQWCVVMREVAERWGSRQLLGVCRSTYGRVLATSGDWVRAEDELVAAVRDLEAARPGQASGGLARLGELRARQGRTDEARALYERAGASGVLGLGELALDAGEPADAADAAERILRRLPAADVLGRVPALELLVRARAELGRLGDARAAFEDLERASALLGTPYLLGRVRLVASELAYAGGDHQEARRAGEDAIDRLSDASAPYDAAVARLWLARALLGLRREDSAGAQARAARDAFAALGAVRELGRVEALLAGAEVRVGAAGDLGELSPREVEILRLVAQGLGDAEIAERLVLSPHTVHRHVANVRTKLRLPSRTAAVAYAARAGLL